MGFRQQIQFQDGSDRKGLFLGVCPDEKALQTDAFEGKQVPDVLQRDLPWSFGPSPASLPLTIPSTLTSKPWLGSWQGFFSEAKLSLSVSNEAPVGSPS